ncbi:MAG: methylated-DNA--[protein]-cysteine S-methyltransferase [Methanobacteriaceae archaeon]|nr:methylated-DNA--[protein]-cysteine S-methyltransferase [Methanobacteriaceae archaeon]
MNPEKTYYKIIKKTPFGSVALLWNYKNYNPFITGVILSNPKISAEDYVNNIKPDFIQHSCELIDKTSIDIQAFLEGKSIKFTLENISMENCSEFQKKVLLKEYHIPWGRITTYQLIAKHLGQEKASRAVGNALARNPFPLIIPCHRAVRSDRSLGGFQGGTEMKKTLLENEGIIIDESGKISREVNFFI